MSVVGYDAVEEGWSIMPDREILCVVRLSFFFSSCLIFCFFFQGDPVDQGVQLGAGNIRVAAPQPVIPVFSSLSLSC